MAKFLSFLRMCLLDTLMGYSRELSLLLAAANIPELNTANIYKLYLSTLSNMNEGYKYPRGNPYTYPLIDCTDKRSFSFRAIQLTIKSFLHSSIEAERKAAEKLNTLFSQYSADFSSSSNTGATGKISSFLIDVKRPDITAAIAVLKMEAKVQHLVDDETSYEETYLLCLMSDQVHDGIEVASNLRSEFITVTRDLIVFIGLRMKEADSAPWVDMYTKINLQNAKFEKNEAIRQAALKRKRDEKKKNEKKEKGKDMDRATAFKKMSTNLD